MVGMTLLLYYFALIRLVTLPNALPYGEKVETHQIQEIKPGV